MTFEQFYSDLISAERWFDQASIHHKPETFRKVAEQVYALALSDSDAFSITPMREHRNHVVNKLNKILPDKPKIDWVAKALQKKEEEKQVDWKPASPEHVDKCVAEFDAMLKNAPMLNHYPRMPLKQQIEEGDWIPAKGAPHPKTSAMELYVRQRHFAWIQQSFDPRTKEPLPTHMKEEDFNILYDEKEAAKLEKKVYKTLKA